MKIEKSSTALELKLKTQLSNPIEKKPLGVIKKLKRK